MTDAQRPLWRKQESVEARAQPEFAFRYWTNIENMTADPGIERVETDGPYRVGMHYFSDSNLLILGVRGTMVP